MGFIESIIVLFALGWISSFLYKKYLRKKNKDWLFFLTVIIILSFWTLELLIYLEKISMAWLNFLPWVNITNTAQSGSYFLWNSFLIFGIDFGINLVPGMVSVAIIIFLSYPLWYHLGVKFGRILHGYYAHEEGILWMLQGGKEKYD